MNNFMNGLINENNFDFTENGAVTHATTRSDLLDMFALGAAMRSRPDEDIVLMFRKAFEENPSYALKCLFYIRDIRGGQGERRFFRLCIQDLANTNPQAMRRNMEYIPEFGRWDDLYTFVGTPLEDDAINLIASQLKMDDSSKANGISLCAKWAKSINTSSPKSVDMGHLTRKALKMSAKEYRQLLSRLRERINVLERLMSANRWDEIEFDKIPSRAGIIYKNAFARRDMIKEKYQAFAEDEDTTVNAGALYPYEVVAKATSSFGSFWGADNLSTVDRAMINKYWANLTDYFVDKTFNGLAVVDTSGSMVGSSASAPLNVAISLGMYCAERAKGPFAGYYISFSSHPQLIKVEGIDFVDKVKRIYKTNLCENTNIEATFDMLLKTALKNQCSQDDIPQNIIIISDMEFDSARGYYAHDDSATLMENIKNKWENAGYKMPHLIFWNVAARHNNIPMLGYGPISFVSGMSPSIFESILTGKSGYELMMDTLNKDRYSLIR